MTATFCRHCGASDESGWGEEQREVPDLPTGYSEEDDDFDYDEYLSREFPDQSPEGKHSGNRRFQAAVVVLICVALLASAILYVWH